MSELPETIEELEDWIHKYADSIPVRENLDGEWKSYYLSDLPFEVAEKHVKRWIAESRIPHRVIK